MKALVEIDAGICGFKTSACVQSDDDQHVVFDVESGCEKIARLGSELKRKSPVDAYQEISPATASVVMEAVRSVLKGCCAGCAVPAGLFKAMQVSAGIALPKDISIRLTKE